MKTFSCKGTITALVTPFNKNHEIDYDALKSLIEFQIKSRIDAILIAGTTGESPSLSKEEKLELMERTMDIVKGRVPVIAGTGTNNTKDSIIMTRKAKEIGVDGALIVAPYYNKPTQNGLYEHYKAIAKSVEIPQIIYNVPGRTGVNILPETQLRLAEECKNIIATKEASGNLGQMMEIIKNAPKGFILLSGDDALTLPAISIGAKGCISVLSNYAPAEFGRMIHFALDGKFEQAKKIHYSLLDLMNLNFVESSPQPVKYVLSQMGYIKEIFRLPLVPMQSLNKTILMNAIKKSGLKIS
ncbi:4-hydroxy-tetrahydrodipicolinate synthase [Bacteroidetes/Chlorobi group bacterium ChocPot_Mid]|jgi:4-hydroxy-tetrahydrodipicolinate synthase|nr:MAG: 4-hydroxy-tetrahydrodipicolinate synthase [Bacteroidetes/Chlorobi group bacterium ChocPot_Mid]